MWLRFDGVRPVSGKKHFYLRNGSFNKSVGGWPEQLAAEMSRTSDPFWTSQIIHWQGLVKLPVVGFGWISSASEENGFFNSLVTSALFPWVFGKTRRRDE